MALTLSRLGISNVFIDSYVNRCCALVYALVLVLDNSLPLTTWSLASSIRACRHDLVSLATCLMNKVKVLIGGKSLAMKR